MSAKLTVRLLCCAVFMIALRADTNFVTSQTKTFATRVGAVAQVVVTGDPAELENVISVCVSTTCNNGSTESPPGQYNWSTSVLHGGDCNPPFKVVANTAHFFNNGSDVGSTESNGSTDCELLPE